jgi:divalent metal cation (Fe/Co/Zn/Cd) transporter
MPRGGRRPAGVTPYPWPVSIDTADRHAHPPAVGPEHRAAAVRKAHLLNRITIGYNAAEGVIAVLAGIAAGSVSLIGFGLDSGVEVSTSLVLAWRLQRERRDGCRAEDDRRATRAIALCFAALALWVGYEAVTQLLDREQPDVSVVGIIVAGLSVVLMPLLARAKKRLGPTLGSQAVISEARQTELCAYLSAVVLLGLGANALAGWWWADPFAALAIAGVATYEAVRTWRAESLEDTCCA